VTLKKKKVANPKSRIEDSITAQQYSVGWELVSTGHTVAQVVNATGMTRPQLSWCMKVGSEKRSMPAYQKRLAEQVARIRARGQEAADTIGAGAVDAVKRSVEITALAQTTARNILAAHFRYKVQQAVQNIQQGNGTEDDLNALSMPHGMRETLKVLKNYADFTETARAFRVVFDSPHQVRDPLTQLPKEAKLDLSGEALIPAATALVEELTGETEISHDIIDDLLPEYRGWSTQDVQTFLTTGQRPDSDFSSGAEGETIVVDGAPEEASEVEP